MTSCRLQSNYSSTVTRHCRPVVLCPIRAKPCLHTVNEQQQQKHIQCKWTNANRSSVMTCISVLGTIANESLPLESLMTDIFLKQVLISRVWLITDASLLSMSSRLTTCWSRVVMITADDEYTCTEQDNQCNHVYQHQHHHQLSSTT